LHKCSRGNGDGKGLEDVEFQHLTDKNFYCLDTADAYVAGVSDFFDQTHVIVGFKPCDSTFEGVTCGSISGIMGYWRHGKAEFNYMYTDTFVDFDKKDSDPITSVLHKGVTIELDELMMGSEQFNVVSLLA